MQLVTGVSRPGNEVSPPSPAWHWTEGKLKAACINHVRKAGTHLPLSLAVTRPPRLGLGLRGKEWKAKLTPMLISRSNGSREREKAFCILIRKAFKAFHIKTVFSSWQRGSVSLEFLTATEKKDKASKSLPYVLIEPASLKLNTDTTGWRRINISCQKKSSQWSGGTSETS